MAMDVTFENEQGFTTGSVDAGVKMTDTSKPAPSAPPPAADPEAAKRAFQDKMFPQPSGQPASGSQPQPSSGTTGQWPSTPEGAQALINRLMESPKFRADYANANNPARAKLVEGMTALFALANPEEQSERGAQPVQDLVENLPDLETFAGIHQPDFGPNAGPVLDQGDWSQYVNFVIEQNITSATAQALADDYATRLAASGGRGLTPDDFADLRVQYAGRLSPAQMDTMQAWIEKEVYPRMRGQRAGERS